MFKIIEHRRKESLTFVKPSARSENYIYCERHHIIPRSWFKQNHLEQDDSDDNCIYLTFVEHIKVHIFLRDYFAAKDNKGMFYSIADALRYFSGKSIKTLQALTINS